MSNMTIDDKMSPRLPAPAKVDLALDPTPRSAFRRSRVHALALHPPPALPLHRPDPDAFPAWRAVVSIRV